MPTRRHRCGRQEHRRRLHVARPRAPSPVNLPHQVIQGRVPADPPQRLADVNPEAPAVALPDFGDTPAITGSAVAVASGDVAPSPAVAAVVVPNLNRAVSLSRFGGLYGP